MTTKQSRFVEEYVASGNAAQAARNAGYSPKHAKQHGNTLLKNEAVQAEISARMAAKSVEVCASADEVLSFLTEVMRDEKQRMTTRMHAAELLGKRHRLFAERVSIATDRGDAEIVIGYAE